jgi:hypothetical protein
MPASVYLLLLLYDQSSPNCYLNSFPAIGLDDVEVWAAKAGRVFNQKGSQYVL